MDINVKVTIGAEPELLMHLATLVECLRPQPMQVGIKVTETQATVEQEKPKKKAAAKPAEKKAEPKPEPEPAPAPVAEEKAPEPEPVPQPEPEVAPKKEVTEEELRAACMEFAKKDPANKKKLAEAFKAVGADKLSAVKPEDRQKVLDLLGKE